MPETTDESPQSIRRLHRLTRPAGWVIGILGVIFLASLGGTLWLLANLDAPWLKAPLLARIHAATGLDLDYQHLRIRTDGIELEQFELRSPLSLRAHTPRLLALDRISAHWDLVGLLHGELRGTILLQAPTLILASDDTGASSLDLFVSSSEEADQSSSEPLLISHLIEIIPESVSDMSLQIDHLSVQLIRLRQGIPLQDIKLDGLSLSISINAPTAEENANPRQSEVSGSSHARIHVRTTAGQNLSNQRLSSQELSPSRLLLTLRDYAEHRESVRSLSFDLGLKLDLMGDGQVLMTGNALMRTQDWLGIPPLPEQLMQLAGRGELQPDRQRVVLSLTGSILGSQLTAENMVFPDLADDSAPVRVDRTKLDVELATLAPFLPLAPGMSGLTLSDGSLHAELTALEILPTQLSRARGELRLTASLGKVGYRDGELELGATSLQAHATLQLRQAEPAEASVVLDAAGVLGMAPGQHLEIPQLSARLEIPGVAADILPALSAFQAASGTVQMSDATYQSPAAELTRLASALKVQVALEQGEVRRLEGELRVPSGVLSLGDAPALDLADTVLAIELTSLLLHPDDPLLSSGSLAARLHLRDLETRLEVSRPADDPGPGTKLVYSLEGRSRHLGRLIPVAKWTLGPEYHIQWSNLGIQFASAGVIASPAPSGPHHLDAHAGIETSHLMLERRTQDGPSLRVEIPQAEMKLSIRGTPDQHDAELALLLPRFTLNGVESRDQTRLLLRAHDDLLAGTVALNLTGREGNGARLSGMLDAGFQRSNRQLNGDFKLSTERFPSVLRLAQALGTGLYPLDDMPPGIVITGSGRLRGLIDAFSSDAGLNLAPDPAASIDGEVHVNASLSNIAWRDALQRAQLSKLDLQTSAEFKRGSLRATLEMKIPGLDVADGQEEVRMEDSQHRFTLVTDGPLREGNASISLRSEVGAFQQSYAPMRAGADLSAELEARIASFSILRVDRLLLVSQQLGTRLDAVAIADRAPGAAPVAEALELSDEGELLDEGELSVEGDLLDEGERPLAGDTTSEGSRTVPGSLPLSGSDDALVAQIPGGQGLAVVGTWTQALNGVEDYFSGIRGSGRLTVPFAVASPDHRFFRVEGTLQFENLELELPGDSFEVRGLNGRLVFLEELRLMNDALTLMAADERNAFALASFPDSQPFLSSDAYFSADSMRWRDLSAGPLAGNLSIDRTLLRLDQLQVGFQEGTITGKLLASYGGKRDSVLFRGNATGLMMTAERERLDANFALGMGLSALDLNGQMHLVTLGPETLRSLLDVLDPYRADVTYNRIRAGLQLGYPEKMQLTFDHGLMDASVRLGGGASVIRIDKIRAVPIGPLLNRYLAPYLKE